jgi:hypothetical protein
MTDREEARRPSLEVQLDLRYQDDEEWVMFERSQP